MIILMKEKDFLKQKKSLVVPKDYVIGDCTDDTTSDISKFSNIVSADMLKPPKQLVRAICADNDKIDPDKIEMMEKKFFKSEEFIRCINGFVRLQIKSDKNYFLVYKNKDFKAFGKKIFKKLRKMYETEEDVFFIGGDISSKILSKKISEDTRRELDEVCRKYEKRLEKMSEEEEAKKDKKKKKKEKDKDKKKKKKKKKVKYFSIDF